MPPANVRVYSGTGIHRRPTVCDAGGNAEAATPAVFTPPVSMFTPGNTPATATARRSGRRAAAQARGPVAGATGGFQRHGQRGFSFKTPAPAVADEAPPGTPMDISPMDCSPFPPQPATPDLQRILQSAQEELTADYKAAADAEPTHAPHASTRPTANGTEAAAKLDRKETSISASPAAGIAAAAPPQSRSAASGNAATEGSVTASQYQQHSEQVDSGAHRGDGPPSHGDGGAADSATAEAADDRAARVRAKEAAAAAYAGSAQARTLFPETLAEAFGAKLHVGGEDAPGRAANEAATKIEQPFSFSFGAAAPNPFTAQAPAAGEQRATVSPTFPGWFQQAASANGGATDRTESATAASARSAGPAPVFGGFTGAGFEGSADGAAPVFGAAGWPQPPASFKPAPADKVSGSAHGAAPVFGGTRWNAASAAAPQAARGMDSSGDSDGDEETSTMRGPRPSADSQPSKRQQRTPRKAVRPRTARPAPKHHHAGGVPFQEAAANGAANGHSSPGRPRAGTSFAPAAAHAAAGLGPFPASASSTSGPASGAANGRHPAAAPADLRMPDHLLRARPRSSPARPSPARKATADAGAVNGHIGSSPKAAMLRYCDGKARSAFQAGRYDEAAQHYSEVILLLFAAALFCLFSNFDTCRSQCYCHCGHAGMAQLHSMSCWPRLDYLSS